jgi:uncharacterized membrane protein
VHYFARHSTFRRALRLSVDPIRHFGASNPVIARKLLDTLARLAAQVPPARALLVEEAEAVLEDARAQVESARDRALVEESARRLLG